MSAVWVYPATSPYSVQGRDLSEDNFAQEDRTSLEILIREALQNPLDARAPDNDRPVRVRIAVLQPGNYDAAYLSALLPPEYLARIQAAGGDPLPEPASWAVLVIEDFGTTGLEGTWRDQNADGSGENWNAFWFREGEGAKATAGSNGRAGQGKITYYRVGAARAVFGYTVRRSDGKTLLMGRSAFRRAYPYKGSKYLRHSFWCAGSENPLPVTEPAELAAFQTAFRLLRTGEPGLSLVIPVPLDFVPKDAIRTIVSEFYYPIARGNLEVLAASLDINAAKVESVAAHEISDDDVRERKSGFTKAFRELVREVIADEAKGIVPVELKAGWEKSAQLSEDAFPEGALAELRKRAEAGERITIRCPIAVRPKRDVPVPSWFDVHIEVPDDLDRVEEAYIRRDLLIGSEKHLVATPHLQKARALTLVRDTALSAFLADAEEPTHLKWNGSRPRLTEEYASPQATLRAVRNAAPRLLAVVLGGMVKRDTKSLARYFTRPATESRRRVGAGARREGTSTSGGGEPPKTVRKPFRIATSTDRVRVVPNGAAVPRAEELPIACVLEIAYEGLDQDPFKSYDPFDFDLADASAHAIALSGAELVDRSGNRLAFRVVKPDFEVEVPGFDSNIRLRARLIYTERNDGALIGEE